MSLPVLVLQHAPWETPGLIDSALGTLPTVRRDVVDDAEPQLPTAARLGGLIVMGGPQDADDTRPGLLAERRLLAEAVDTGLPVLGVCLGMQLLALALGAELHRRHGTEIGFAPVDLTAAGRLDPVLGRLGGPAPVVLHWHDDAVGLPSGAELLATSPATPVQAFRAGAALGLQFHLETDPPLIRRWLDEPAMAGRLDPERTETLRTDADAVLPRLGPRASAGLETFVELVQARRG